MSVIGELYYFVALLDRAEISGAHGNFIIPMRTNPRCLDHICADQQVRRHDIILARELSGVSAIAQEFKKHVV